MTLPQDKITHAVVGFAVALGTLALLWIGNHLGAPIAMVAAGLAIGGAYEIVQKVRGEGVPDAMDAIATAVGAAAAALGAWALM